jgi:hypothetical protein
MEQVLGITIERTTKGIPVFARIDLRKHSDIIPILENKGAEVERPINWSEKMQQAINEKEFSVLDMDNFWDE